VLQNPDEPYGAHVFLRNWELEIRAGYSPNEDLDVLMRLNEYLDLDVPADVEATLSAEVSAASVELLRYQREIEAQWGECTRNDRITFAFAELERDGYLARECFGLTIEDGWVRVGLEAQPDARGAAFFHQQDVHDALSGHSLPLAFGPAGEAPGCRDEAAQIAQACLEALARAGVAASWSGDPLERIEIAPFEWRRRRYTDAPPATSREAIPWTQTPRQVEPFPEPDEADLPRFGQPVYAHQTCDGFDSVLAAIMRGVWIAEFSGQRGQVHHLGQPHTFIRAGETALMCPGDGLRNLPLADAAALRQRALAGRPCEPKRPWWKLWN
jgi:hypothetical protein